MAGDSIELSIGRRIASMLGVASAACHQRPTLLLLLVAIVLPNALFVGAILAGIGTPPRPGAIVSYLTVAVIARAFGCRAGVIAFLIALTYDLINTISLLFGLSFLEIAATLGYARELQLFQSPLYIALGLGMLATSGLTLWLLTTMSGRLRQARLLPALLGTFALAAVDVTANTSLHYHFGTAFSADQPFESAVKASGFEAVTNSPQRPNLLLVIVEGMGQFADSRRQALVTDPFDDPELQRRYAVTRGAITYFGSTTAAEMRELCATRDPYRTLLDQTAGASAESSRCLPVRLANRGYRTIGLHGFTGVMFDRDRWWPQIGLQETVFGEQLVPPLPICGAVFKGACDTAISVRLRDWLIGQTDPRFVYWLTLNTHIPIKTGEHSGHFACGDGGSFDKEMVCHMAGMWHDVFQQIVKLALDPALPRTEILVVGDHAPPLWSREDRALFKPGKVSWIRLAASDRSMASAGAAAKPGKL